MMTQSRGAGPRCVCSATSCDIHRSSLAWWGSQLRWGSDNPIIRYNSSAVHRANILPDLPPLELAPPQPEPTIDEQSATIAPQDMTYCTAPDTTATEADVTVQATTSARGRGIPRGRGTSARGRTVVSARVAVAPGGKKPPANAVEKRKREVRIA